MESDARTRLKRWLASGKARLEPLSFPQRELWEASGVAPDDASNNICGCLHIRAPLSRAICTEALGHVINRQEALRTTFVPGKERPLQVVRTEANPVLTYREALDSSDDDECVVDELQDCFHRPLDLLRGPLYRIEMIKRGTDHHTLAFAIHHSIADGWTVSNFVHDLTTACLIEWQKAGHDMSRFKALRLSLGSLEMTHAQWAAAERARWTEPERAKHADYWKRRLEGSHPLFRDAPPLTPAPVSRWKTEVPPTLAAPMRDLAKKCGTTLFVVLLSAFRLALFRWRGEADVVVGTPVAGRGKSAVRETMGCFSATVPLRAEINPGAAFTDILDAQQRAAVDDFAQAMPFAELAVACGATKPAGRHPVFDVRFALQNYPPPDIDMLGISTRFEMFSTGTARFDIGCEITENGRKLELVWLHRTDVLKRADVAELDLIFRAVLSKVGSNPAISPAELETMKDISPCI